MLTYEECRHRAIVTNNTDVITACNLADDHYSDASLEISEDLQTAFDWLQRIKRHCPAYQREDLEVFLANLRAESKVR